MVWRRGRRQGPWAVRVDCRRRRSVHPGSFGWDADSGAPLAGRQVRVAANSPNLRGVAAPSRRLAECPPLPTQAPEGALRVDSHSWAEALGARSRTSSRVLSPPPSRLCSLGWSASSVGNSRQGRRLPRRLWDQEQVAVGVFRRC